MTDPTYPGDIYVYGQRRQPDGSFPSGGGGSGGGGQGEDPGIHQDEVTDPEYIPPPNPCDHPVARKIWNADAAAIAAAPALFAKAASLNDGSTLSNREFFTNLFSRADGSVGFTDPIFGGPAVQGQVPNVVNTYSGVSSADWMGDLHNHPSGDARLSDGEWNTFINQLSQFSATNPERRPELEHVAAYVLVLDASSPRGYRVHANTRDTPYNQLGPEVNPDAQPCP